VRRAPALLALLLSACAAGDAEPEIPDDPRPSSARLTARPLGTTGAPLGFQEYLPPGYPIGPRRPLLVFLHGVGENGNGTTDLPRVLANGPPKLIAQDAWPNARPFVVLSPQHVGGGCPGAEEVHAFLTWAKQAYRIDDARVYLTGLSCGAIGAWSYLGAHRGEDVAAAVLVCGDPGDPASAWSAWGRAGCGLGDVAIWSFHGDADATVNIAGDRATMANLEACPAERDAKFTELPGAGHAIWGGVYDGSTAGDVFEWMLEHPSGG